jgi:flagellar M-ring protein FliF
MNQFRRIWNSMSMAQRISLAVVPALLCLAVWGLTRWRHEKDFRAVYTSLAPEDASALTQKLRESGIEYRLDETGSTILAPSARIAEARLAAAGAGLPRTGRIGFELFDRTNLGASDFTEQVNYRRALEGELERTVSSLSGVEQARVHITFPKESVFLDSRQPAKATVVLKLRRIERLPQASVTAIANLIASAVDDLSPQAVAIVDSGGRLLNRPRSSDTGDAAMADANLEYRRELEVDLSSRISAALEPLVGEGRFRVGVNVDCDFSSSEENNEIYDSAKSAITQSQTSEESASAGLRGGQPGTASNLPNPPAKEAAGTSGIVRRTESVSYQPGRTIRRTVSPKGVIRRISTAVLVDQTARWEGIGARAKRVLIPPPPEVLKGVRDVIAGITGYSDQRGDQITVETLPFENTLSAEQPAAPPPPKAPLIDLRQPMFVYGGSVALLLLLAVVFLLMKRSGAKSFIAEDTTAAGLPATGENTTGKLDPTARMQQQIADNEAEQAALEAQALSHIKLPPRTKTTEVLARHIREAVEKDPVNASNVLRTWVTDLEPKRQA